ncbi:type I toxin-antitoxin system Ibs family toxin [Salmonella enterica subsp. houtenae]|nr:type I toxin-antitoxin system Ibs family toxin [Salmonella enterica subsp. houtenae]ECE5923689.1 hypothetical protein [Salmonella enterica subsp. houtenae]EDR3244696.1 type I toxin-antitoxin system Ibs family toxin [Salmonella enterica subsp. houtenae]EFV0027827.1 type I toxin-antitoxin system Ibs family toxin [Salmonella enterica]EIZ8058185.1 type I toxin-antitoxin system Ibs family toxin [Salmonella enterica]
MMKLVIILVILLVISF